MEYRRICRKQRQVSQGCDVYISRGCNGGGWNIDRSKWDVPSAFSKLPAEEMQQRYREHVLTKLADDIPELAYQQLGCWCKSEEECHAKVLRELVAEYLAQAPAPTPSISANAEFALVISKDPVYKVTKRKRDMPPATATKALKKKRPPPIIVVAQPEVVVPAPAPAPAPPSASKELVVHPNDTGHGARSSVSSVNEFLEFYKDVLTPEGKVPISAFITQPIVRKEYCNRPPFKPEGWTGEITELPEPVKCVNSLGIEVIFEPIWPWKPPPFIPADHTHTLTRREGKPTKGFISMLRAGGVKSRKVLLGMDMEVIDWPPFVARVVKIIRNKANGRFSLMVSEESSDKADKANSAKVHLASQIFSLIENRHVRKDDLVYVEQYAITKVGLRKHIIVVTEMKKAVVAT